VIQFLLQSPLLFSRVQTWEFQPRLRHPIAGKGEGAKRRLGVRVGEKKEGKIGEKVVVGKAW
jgi:hypothetical protein